MGQTQEKETRGQDVARGYLFPSIEATYEILGTPQPLAFKYVLQTHGDQIVFLAPMKEFDTLITDIIDFNGK